MLVRNSVFLVCVYVCVVYICVCLWYVVYVVCVYIVCMCVSVCVVFVCVCGMWGCVVCMCLCICSMYCNMCYICTCVICVCGVCVVCMCVVCVCVICVCGVYCMWCMPTWELWYPEYLRPCTPFAPHLLTQPSYLSKTVHYNSSLGHLSQTQRYFISSPMKFLHTRIYAVAPGLRKRLPAGYRRANLPCAPKSFCRHISQLRLSVNLEQLS